MKYKLLNEICTPKQWATISGKNLLQNGSYDVYGANGVIGKYSTYNHSEETVVVGCRGTCGSDSVRIVPPMSYINGNAMCFDSLSKDYLKKYFFYYLKSLDYSKIITGVAQPQITAKALNTLKVPDISKDRQKEIVEVLDKINRLIELNVKQLISLDELIKSRFIEMFGDPEFNPFAFEIREFSKLGNLARGKSKHRPRNDAALLGGPYPLIQTGDVSNADLYIKKYSSTYSELGLKQSKMWAKGTLCITIAANIAESAILDFDACFPDSVVGFEPNEEFNVLFVKYHLDALKSYLDRQATSVAQKNLNLEKLSSSPFMAPPIELQNEFASFVEQIDKSKFIVQKRIDTYKELLAKKMDEYFN